MVSSRHLLGCDVLKTLDMLATDAVSCSKTDDERSERHGVREHGDPEQARKGWRERSRFECTRIFKMIGRKQPKKIN